MAANWTIERSSAALRDILDIWDYLADRDEGAADRFVMTVENAISRLSDFPNLGAERDDLAQGLRAISFNPYLLFYRISVERRRIQIARVIDARRDLASFSWNR